MAEPWRLLDTGLRNAAENMALDEVILTARDQGLAPNTLRFLQFQPKCVLIGYHQAVNLEVREDFCLNQGIEINRRITGGGALYWDEKQLGWEIIADRELISGLGDVERVYRILSKGLVEGLGSLGINAAFRSRNDIEVNGRKISGLGGTEKGGAFLFQGTLLVDFDVETMFRCLRVPAEKLIDKELSSARERVTSVTSELGFTPPMDKIKQAVAAGFSRALGIKFQTGNLTSAEERQFDLRSGEFSSRKWVYGVKKSALHGGELRSIYKAPGGIIRVSLLVDIPGRRIKYALISGDFFAYPQRAVYDLEALLKNCRFQDLERTVQGFFAQANVKIPGITWADVNEAIQRAIKRSEKVEWGFSPEEANSITEVSERESIETNGMLFLLPYCAKKTSCSWRQKQGCVECGECSVGEAYALARSRGMIPVSINNYEELKEVLSSYQKIGCTGYVGCCCEPFYAKHQQDFAEIGLPGVLIDIENVTCYELGKLDEAKLGKFDQQTQLKLPLIEKVLDWLELKAQESGVGENRCG